MKNFRENDPGSTVIRKMANDPLRVFRCYFRINKGHDHILLVDHKKIPRSCEKIFYNIFYWFGTVSLIKDNFDTLYAST